MKSVIWKYPLKVDVAPAAVIPIDGTVLHVDVQGGEPFAWVEHRHPPFAEQKQLLIRGTGHEFERQWPVDRHVGTFLHGPFVWHVYEVLG